MAVIFISEVQKFLEELVPILYENGYFSFEENAQEYVDDLIDDIMDNLPTRRHKPAPPHFDRYGAGMYYAAFKKSKNTTWYAFFTKYLVNSEEIFLVRYINNNHMIAQYL